MKLEKPLSAKIDRLRGDYDEQAGKVQHYEKLLAELLGEIQNLSARITIADRLTEIVLREQRTQAERKRDICRDEVVRHAERLQNIRERVQKQEAKLEAVRSKYTGACTTGADLLAQEAARKRAEAEKMIKDAARKADSINRLADETLNGENDDAAQRVDALRREATRQKVMLTAEAKLLQDSAERLERSVSHEQDAARQALIFHGGLSEVKKANDFIEKIKEN